MFRTKIKSENIKDITNALLAIVREAKWSITPDGITIRAVDAANVSMVGIDIKKEAFENYEATEAELGIDIAKLNGLLDMAEKDVFVEIELDEASHKLNIRMGILNYTVALLDPSTLRKAPKIPMLDLPGTVIMKGGDMRRAIKAGSTVSREVYISFERRKVKFTYGAPLTQDTTREWGYETPDDLMRLLPKDEQDFDKKLWENA